ncbi:MAG: DNA primase, partial [Patescibacteria group bacterium]
MAGDTVQQIKDRLSIVDVVSQYVKLERAGGSMRARCPFHAEKTPSFFVSPDRGTYHCFGCGVGGDVFSFVESIEGLDFKGALKVLAEKAGVELVYERGGKEKRDERERLFELLETATIFYTSRLTDAAKKYLTERGIADGTVQAFRVGWAGDAWSELSDFLKTKKFSDKEILDAGVAKNPAGQQAAYGAGNERSRLIDKFRNRIMFPIADSAGRVVGFSGRIFGEKASPEAPKYLNSPETPLFHKSRILYGLDRAKLAIRKHNFAVLVEGQMDLLSSHQAGWSNTVAVSGTAFTTEHAQIIKRLSDNLVLALDADEAGIKAAGPAAPAARAGAAR